MIADLTHAMRSLGRRPGPGATGAVVAGVGIGLAVIVFALGDPYLSRPLPYPKASRLVGIEIRQILGQSELLQQENIPTFAHWQARADLFDGLAAFGDRSLLRMRLQERTVPLRTMAVSRNFVAVLGVGVPGVSDVGDDLAWITKAAADRLGDGKTLIGRAVPLVPSGSVRIAGILPHSFIFPQASSAEPVDALVAFQPGQIATVDRSHGPTEVNALHLIGRIRHGADPDHVEAALNTALASTGFRVAVSLLPMLLKERLQSLAAGALLASLLVLLVCCANTAGIALTRGLHRAGEIAMLEILGGTRGRIARLLVAEAGVVGMTGTVLGLGVSVVGLPALRTIIPAKLTALGVPMATPRVLVFAALAGLVVVVSWCLGSLTSWRLGARQSVRAIHRDGRAVRAIRFVLIAGQLTAAAVLLAGAGLLGRSYLNLSRLDTGLDGSSLAFTVAYPPEASSAHLLDAIERTVARLRRVPGVAAVAASVGGDSDRLSADSVVIVGGRPVLVERAHVTTDFFSATGMQFVTGRPLAPEDDRHAVVINQTLSRRAFARGHALGEVLLVGGQPSTVAGVVRDARDRGLIQSPRPAVFLPILAPTAEAPVVYSLRCSASTRSLLAEGERVIQSVDRGAAVLDASSLQERLSRSVADRSFATLVMVLFAAATTIITIAGLWGVVAYVVTRRTREVGIRLAVGANGSTVVWLVMREAMVAAVCGAVGGIVVSLWLSRTLEALLFDVASRDLLTLSFTTAGLLVLAFGAAVIPARRAGRLSPMVALRMD